MYLYNALKASYGNKNSQSQLEKRGFKKDDQLSNHNQHVYYNPSNQKLLYSVAGTHNLSDIGTDVALAFGHLKSTNRYKEADETLKKAKAKYGTDHATVVGASLGGGIAGYISGKQDKVYTHNKAATIGQPVRNNETHYRTYGDAISIMNANSTNTKTLPNHNPSSGSMLVDTFNAHKVDNLKGSGIFV